MNGLKFSRDRYYGQLSLEDSRAPANKWNVDGEPRRGALSTDSNIEGRFAGLLLRAYISTNSGSCGRIAAGLRETPPRSPVSSVVWRQEAFIRQLVRFGGKGHDLQVASCGDNLWRWASSGSYRLESCTLIDSVQRMLESIVYSAHRLLWDSVQAS